MNMKSAIAAMILILFADTSSAGWLSHILGPQLEGLVNSQLGYYGSGPYASQLNNYYSSLPAGTICSYSYCNTDAVNKAIASRYLWSNLLFSRSWGPGW